MSKTFWNSSHGRMERALREALAEADLDRIDTAAESAAIATAKAIDLALKAQPATMFGDVKWLFHYRLLIGEYGRCLDRLLLSPQSRISIAETTTAANPFTEAADNVRSLVRD